MQRSTTLEIVLLSSLIVAPISKNQISIHFHIIHFKSTSLQNYAPLAHLQACLHSNTANPHKLSFPSYRGNGVDVHLLSTVDEPLLCWWDALLLFDALLDLRHLVVRFDIELDFFTGQGTDSVNMLLASKSYALNTYYSCRAWSCGALEKAVVGGV
jgi:hypothetical protein